VNQGGMVLKLNKCSSLFKPEALRAINAFFDIIREQVACGNEVALPKFGKFFSSKNKNKMYPKFRASSRWLRELNEQTSREQEQEESLYPHR